MKHFLLCTALIYASLVWSQQTNPSPAKSINTTPAPGAPLVYTDEAAFLAAINNNYYLENFDSYDWGTVQNQTSITLSSGSFSYSINASTNLFSILSAMSTEMPLAPMTITSNGHPFNYFGGYFISTDENRFPGFESILIELGVNHYTNNNEVAPSFIGFILPTPVTSFVLSNVSGINFTAINQLYVGYAPYITNVKELTTARNTPITLSLQDMTAISPKGETMSLGIKEGANYTVNGSTITPANGYVGRLNVPVTVTDATATSAAYTVPITVTLPTAIDEPPTSNERFYPNPCYNGFTINSNSFPAVLTIRSLTGKVVLEQVVNNGTFVPVHNLANGIYLVTFNGKSEKLVVKK